MKEQQKRYKTGEYWNEKISNRSEYLRLLPRICEAILYMPHLFEFFNKLHKKYIITELEDSEIQRFSTRDFFHYNIYNYIDLKVVLKVLIDAENKEELRVEIFKKLSLNNLYSNASYIIEDGDSIKGLLDSYIRYYYNWLFFSLPTKNKNNQDEIKDRKSIIQFWESLNYKTNKVSLVFDGCLNSTYKNVEKIEEVFIDIFIKKNFKYLKMPSLLLPTFLLKTIDNSRVVNKDIILKKSEINVSKKANEDIDAIKKLNNDYYNYHRDIERIIFVYHSMMLLQGENVLELLQSFYLNKSDIRHIVRESSLLIPCANGLDKKFYNEYFLWVVICRIFSLLQYKKHDKCLTTYINNEMGSSDKNIDNNERKLHKLFNSKEIEIKSLERIIEKNEEESKNNISNLRRLIKDQEKTIYELSKQIELLKSNQSLSEVAKLNNLEIVNNKNIINNEQLKNDREITEEEFLEVIKNYNICIYGGQPKWQNKIKRKYPDLHMIEATDNVSLKPLDKAFLIIYVNIWTSHCAWERVVSYAESLNVPKGYLNNYNEKFLWEVVVREVTKINKNTIEYIAE